MIFDRIYDIIVVGGGHAGSEAALASARMGASVLLLTISIDKIALMSCNPAIGGLAKGNLVKDLDALGGEMAKNIDASCIALNILNRRKGIAAQSSRAQADKLKYASRMKETLLSQKGLDVKQAIVSGIITEKREAKGVTTLCGQNFYGRKTIICSGTFLNGKIYIGSSSIEGGRAYEPASMALSSSLASLGFKSVRLKTGTPARIRSESIDYSRLIPYDTGGEKRPFSFETEHLPTLNAVCWSAYTNENTHRIVKENLSKSLYYSSVDKGIGPRYCPSMEDKVTKFPNRERHRVILEPEGVNSNEVYPNGFSTSLPAEVQLAAYRTIEGLENCRFTRPAYAIEYEGFQPTELYPSYETKAVKGLYFAGQINGTSGYEEAAVQGFMAGVNAVLSIGREEIFTLGRNESYIGVLTDDLVTKGIDEPYRMFTSRGEYRLHLREDNAEYRLLKYGRKLGLITEERYKRFFEEKKTVEKEVERLKTVSVKLNEKNKSVLEKAGVSMSRGRSAYDFLKMPETSYRLLKEMGLGSLDGRAASQAEIMIKYSDYIAKQDEDVERFARLEKKKIPADFSYYGVAGLRREYAEKLDKIRPSTLGQALRIPGMSPSAISVLDIAIKKMDKS